MLEFFSWEWLVKRGPNFAWAFTLVMVFGSLITLSLVDLLVFNPGRDLVAQRGVLSYWMSGGFDSLVLPVIVAITIAFYQRSVWFPNNFSIILSLGGGILFAAVFVVFQVVEGTTNWSTLANSGMINLYGLWHAVLMAAIMQYLIQFFMWGAAYLVTPWGARLAVPPADRATLVALYLVSAALLAGSLVIFVGWDRIGLVPTPGGILARLTGLQIFLRL